MVGIVVLRPLVILFLCYPRQNLHYLSQLEFVENGRFSSCVKTHHQDSHLLLSP